MQIGYGAVFLCIAAFLLGVIFGAGLVFKFEEKTIRKLVEDCRECRVKLEAATATKEVEIESKWPKQNPQIKMKTSVADYLRDKYMSTEDRSESDDADDWCE